MFDITHHKRQLTTKHFYLNEVCVNLRHLFPQVYTDLIQIEMLQASIAGIVEQYHNGHNLWN